jgi:enterochelin esterase family protein
MAQFIRLAVNLQEGRNLDTPDVVYNRYVRDKKGETTINLSAPNPGFSELPVNTRSANDLLKLKPNEKTGEKTAGNGVDPLKITIPLCEQSYRTTSNLPTPRVLPKDWEPSSIPEVSINHAVFFYRGDGKEVEVVGDFTGWKPNGFKMKKVLDTDWKCFEMEFAGTARVEYKLIVDGKWINDPLNPNKNDNGVGGENSFFTMPDYKPTVWDKREVQGFYFQTFTEEIDSKIYGKRNLEVFSPFGMQSEPLPVLYLLDGTDYIRRAEALVQVQNLINAGKVKPFRIVFIDYKDRLKEYFASDDFAKYLATEIVPAIDAKYTTIKSRDGRAVMGASLGGISSFHAALKYPEVFRRVGGQSSSFWVDNERVVKELEKLNASKNKFTFYIDDGTLEGVEDSRNVDAMLRGKGFTVTYIEGESGHNWISWRDRLANAFIALWK